MRSGPLSSSVGRACGRCESRRATGYTSFLIGRVDGPSGIGGYDIEWGRWGLLGVLRLPGERGAGCFSDDAWHAVAAAVCWRQLVEHANGLGVEVLQALNRLWRLVIEDVVRRFVICDFLSLFSVLILFRRRCFRGLVAWRGGERGSGSSVGPVAPGCVVNVGGRAPAKIWACAGGGTLAARYT